MDSTLKEILYLLFGINESANINDLKKAYRKRANEFHSDKNDDVDPNIFIALTKGYELLQTDIKGEVNESKEDKQTSGPAPYSPDLNEDQLKRIAAEKMTNTFNDVFQRHLMERFVTRKDIFIEVKQMFGQETAGIRQMNRDINVEIDLLTEAKLRIKSKTDTLNLTANVEEMISHRRISIRQNKNKIQINNFVNEFLDEYSFVHPKDASINESELIK